MIIKIAIVIIAACEVVRALQNHKQISMLKRDTSSRDNAYAEFVKSLKMNDREFVKRMLQEFDGGGLNEEVQNNAD